MCHKKPKLDRYITLSGRFILTNHAPDHPRAKKEKAPSALN